MLVISAFLVFVSPETWWRKTQFFVVAHGEQVAWYSFFYALRSMIQLDNSPVITIVSPFSSFYDFNYILHVYFNPWFQIRIIRRNFCINMRMMVDLVPWLQSLSYTFLWCSELPCPSKKVRDLNFTVFRRSRKPPCPRNALLEPARSHCTYAMVGESMTERASGCYTLKKRKKNLPQLKAWLLCDIFSPREYWHCLFT